MAGIIIENKDFDSILKEKGLEEDLKSKKNWKTTIGEESLSWSNTEDTCNPYSSSHVAG